MLMANVSAAEKPIPFESVRTAALYTPLPDLYRAWLTRASCVLDMTLDSATGRVSNVRVVQQSGDPHLAFTAVQSLKRWKFRPGTPSPVRISLGTMPFVTQQVFEPQPVGKSKRMADVLAPFLHRNTLVRGDLPEYPTGAQWTNKRGTGVYELAIDKDGKVSRVNVKSSSGDRPFDRATVVALQRWQFERGPLILELPLSFVLTARTFSVHIPKHP
jgi:TonB family protein